MTPARRLVLDIQACQDPVDGRRGLGRVVQELAAALDARDGAVAAILLNPALPPPVRLAGGLSQSSRLGWNTPGAVAALAGAGPIAYHVMAPFNSGPGPSPPIPGGELRDGVALIVTLHDLIPLHDPDRLLRGQAARRHRARCEVVAAADLVLCVSAFTRADAVARLGADPGRLVAVGNGAGEDFRPADPGDDDAGSVARALPELAGRAPVVAVAGGDERKNTSRLIAAYATLPAAVRRRHPLALVCDTGPAVAARWRADATAAGVGADVVLTGFLSDEVLVSLHRCAALAVLASLDEGYGLPVAEAIACGTPAITSSTTALPEILDLPESTFDPLDTAAMGAALLRGLTDAPFRARLLAAGRAAAPRHRWSAVAGRVMEAVAALDGVRRAG